DTFTLRELREVHEIVLQRDLDPANFRRQVAADAAVVPTEDFRTGGRHRPARLYRCNTAIEPVGVGRLTPRPAASTRSAAASGASGAGTASTAHARPGAAPGAPGAPAPPPPPDRRSRP